MLLNLGLPSFDTGAYLMINSFIYTFVDRM